MAFGTTEQAPMSLGQTRSGDGVSASSVCAVVMAAGSSKRMGFPKQLAKISGLSLVERAALTAKKSGITDVRVVAGEQFPEIKALMDAIGVDTLYNSGWNLGQSASVRMAARYARSMGRRWLLVLPVDMPFVTESHLQRLLRSAQENIDAWAAVSQFGEMRMAPCLFGSQAFRFLESLSGDAGAAKVIRDSEFRQRCVAVPFASEREAFDVDTPEDLERAKAVML